MSNTENAELGHGELENSSTIQNGTDSTAIRIDNDVEASERGDTRVNISMEGITPENLTLGRGRFSQRNLLSLFNEARTQLGRQTHGVANGFPEPLHIGEPQPHFSGATIAGESSQLYDNGSGDNTNPPARGHGRQLRAWRQNLLSFLSQSSGFRYSPLDANERLEANNDRSSIGGNNMAPVSSRAAGVPFRLALTQDERHNQQGNHEHSTSSPSSVSSSSPSSPIRRGSANGTLSRQSSNSSNRTNSNQANANPPGEEYDDNVFSEQVLKVLRHIVRYIPFLCILLVKFIHDQFLGIMDIVFLHCILVLSNRSLCDQVAKLSQKQYGVLLRDLFVVSSVVISRILVSNSTPDAFGMLIAPKWESATIQVALDTNKIFNPDADSPHSTANTIKDQLKQLSEQEGPLLSTQTTSSDVTVSRTVSLGILMYTIIVNDLLLKLITVGVKIIITMLPAQVMRHKEYARMYALIEYISQLCRVLVPIRQWLMYFYESYSGLEMISGFIFSGFYLGAKIFEIVECGKSLKKSVINFVQNMDYERKPTKDELDAAGATCPICHDSYTTPVVLVCNHIFCDDCVNTWFKREQTCPMCRANVSDDPSWQDGATKLFIQIF